MHKIEASQAHPRCCICGGSGAGSGLGVHYQVLPDGSVKAVVACPPAWEGYPGWVHGGIEAALIDGAMTHCLFGLGIAGVTADLRIRYQRPLELGYQAVVTSRCLRCTARYYQLRAQVTQRGYSCAAAVGIFMNLPVRKAKRR